MKFLTPWRRHVAYVPSGKPHLIRLRREWACGIHIARWGEGVVFSHDGPIGFGVSPAAAYQDWRVKGKKWRAMQ